MATSSAARLSDFELLVELPSIVMSTSVGHGLSDFEIGIDFTGLKISHGSNLGDSEDGGNSASDDEEGKSSFHVNHFEVV